jgi:hypothetical protein
MRNPDCLKYHDCLEMAADENLNFDCEGCDHTGITRKPKEEFMGKVCEILDCDKKAQNKGLCTTHWYRWSKGKIDHPRLGKYQDGAPGPEVAKVKQGPVPEVKTEITILSHLRNDLKRVKAFADVLSLLEQGDQARLEIKAYLHEYINE